MANAKKIKNIIKKNPAPASTYGKHPRDPWSMTAASGCGSGGGMSEESINETKMLDKYLSSRGINPLFVSVDTKDAHAKSNEFKKWLRDHQVDYQREDITYKRDSGDARSKQVSSPTAQRQKDLKKANKHYQIKGVPVKKQLNPAAVTRAPIIPHGHKVREKMKEQIEENSVTPLRDKDDLQAKRKALQDLQLDPNTAKDPSLQQAIINRRNILDKQIKNEDLIGDPKSATISPADGANGGEERADRVMSRKAKMVKDILKKSRKDMNIMGEDMTDWEKEDKSVATYGKKPKFEKLDDKNKENNNGEEKSQALGVLSGGTTLTGAKRDTVEIDPLMRSRPGQPDPTKKKDDKKDDKKDKPKEAPRG